MIIPPQLIKRNRITKEIAAESTASTQFPKKFQRIRNSADFLLTHALERGMINSPATPVKEKKKMHTAKQMIPAVGSQVMVRFDGFGIPMLVTDAKSAYGRVRLQVRPMGGQGEAWIECDRVLHVIFSSRVETANTALEVK